MTDASEESSMGLAQQCRKHMRIDNVHFESYTYIVVIHTWNDVRMFE
jgi:hypothetical protein